MNQYSINSAAIKGIHDYCEQRNYKCKTCRYSINKVGESKYATCIFDNCPCSWEIKKKEETT